MILQVQMNFQLVPQLMIMAPSSVCVHPTAARNMIFLSDLSVLRTVQNAMLAKRDLGLLEKSLPFIKV